MELETTCVPSNFILTNIHQNNKLNIINRGDYVKI